MIYQIAESRSPSSAVGHGLGTIAPLVSRQPESLSSRLPNDLSLDAVLAIAFIIENGTAAVAEAVLRIRVSPARGLPSPSLTHRRIIERYTSSGDHDNCRFAYESLYNGNIALVISDAMRGGERRGLSAPDGPNFGSRRFIDERRCAWLPESCSDEADRPMGDVRSTDAWPARPSDDVLDGLQDAGIARSPRLGSTSGIIAPGAVGGREQ